MAVPVKIELSPEVRRSIITCALAVADTIDSLDAVIDDAEKIIMGGTPTFDVSNLLRKLGENLDVIEKYCGLEEEFVKRLKEEVSYIQELVNRKDWQSTITRTVELQKNILNQLTKEAY
jgi:hypothetical protein